MNNDSLLHFAPYLFLLTSDSNYYLNYWVSVPEGHKVGSTTQHTDSQTSTRVITIEVEEASGHPAEIVKVEMTELTDLEGVVQIKVLTKYTKVNEAKEKFTILKLEYVEEASAEESISVESILPYKPYGYFAKDAETSTYYFYYLFYSPEARDLHPATLTPSEGDKLFLEYTLDVVIPGPGRLYHGVTEVPTDNLSSDPYILLDAYVDVLEESAESHGLGQPVNKGAVVIFYEDAD